MLSSITPTKHAFSLVELSIVLVILGLLVGGVLSGQSLIHAAELRSVSTDVNKYVTALQSFRDKYFALPGDMNNATQFWGVAAGTGANAACFNFYSTGTETCNGDGNGSVDSRTDLGGGYSQVEGLRGWQQLTNAKIIEGYYPGSSALTGGPFASAGITIPKGKISKSSYFFADTRTGWSNGLTGQNLGHTMFFGAPDPSGGVRAPVISAEDAWNIDMKNDDGNPDTGRVIIDTTNASCYTGSIPSRSYAVSTSGINCALRFRILD